MGCRDNSREEDDSLDGVHLDDHLLVVAQFKRQEARKVLMYLGKVK